MIDVAAAGDLAPAAVEMFGDLDASAEVTFGSAYEHVERADRDMIRSYLEPASAPWSGPASSSGCWSLSMPVTCTRLRRCSGQLTVPTLIVWGTDDVLFDVSWAYWVRDTIPGTARVVTVDGARLLFPEERLMDLVHLEQHSAAVTPGPGVTSRELRAAEASSFDM